MPTVEVSNWGDAIFLALSNALNSLLAAIPLIIGALVIIVIGWIIAGIVARIVTGLLRRAGADRLFAEHGGDVYGEQSRKVQPSVVGGELVKWLIRIVFLVAAANVLGLTQVSLLLNDVLLWIPNLIVAVVILLVAPILARFVRGAIEVGAGETGFTNGRPLAGSPRSRSWPSPSSSRSTRSASLRTWSTPCSSASWLPSHLRSDSPSGWEAAMLPRS